MNILNALIIVSEKAANIARVCRQNKKLFALLVQEKDTNEANSRFLQDFKTLADVLIQETVRHDIKQHYPILEDCIYGEENNIFTNTLGETIEVKVCSCQNETSKLLEVILDGDCEAANVLAREVHREISLSDINLDNTVLPTVCDMDIENLSIWIDPIDSTAEYISGKESQHENGIYLSGLRCVTVLIGAYDKITGRPLIGVINQPFYEEIGSDWQGKCYWGCVSNQNTFSSQISNTKTKTISLSKVELESIKKKLSGSGFTLVEAAGAGYKLLTVINGSSDAYIVSQGTTYRWDTCGPHAILRAMGGNVFSYTGDSSEISYKDDKSSESKMEKYCNKNGLIAVRDKDTYDAIMHLLRE